MKQGFTLIEMLVVVLIMAILAAIALPHYQLAIDKARFMEAITYVDAIKEAEEMYYLMHRKYTTDLGELDIKLPYKRDKYTADRFDLGGSGHCYADMPWVNYGSTSTGNGHFFVWCKKVADKNVGVFTYMDHANEKGAPFDEKWHQRFCMPIKSNVENLTPRIERLCKSFGTKRMGAGGEGSFPSSKNFVGWPIPQ